MIPATISTMLSTTSPVTAPPKISIDNRKPTIGVSASPNGTQWRWIAGAALRHPMSEKWRGYWNRSAA
jgi:hypothetical protein